MGRLLFLQNLDYEFLGPMYIASSVRHKGHLCQLSLGQTLDDFRGVIESFQPDLIGFSIMTGSHRWAQDMARQVKEAYGIPNIFGGAHPTFFPGFLKEPGVDMIVRGEGEEAVTELLDAIENGGDHAEIQNLGFKVDGDVRQNPVRRLQRDLDFYPFPDRQLYDALEGRLDRSVRNIITSRGCPWHCSFCFEDAMRDLYKGKGKYVRIRSIDRVLEECHQVKDETDARVIFFADDVFGIDRKWLYTFLEQYQKQIGLPFVCVGRADLIAADPAYAGHLARGGCQTMFFGIESGNEELRNKVLSKRLTDREIRTAAKALHDAGIKFRTYNIMGLPGETLADALKTVELNVAIGTDYPWCSIFSPIPGVALTELAIREGYLGSDFNPSVINQSFFLDNPLDLPEKREMQNLQKFFQTAVYWPWTLPFIKLLIRLPENRLFNLWFGFMYFVNYVRSEQKGVLATLRFAMKNWRHVLTKA